MNPYNAVNVDLSMQDEDETFWIMFANFARAAKQAGWINSQIELVLREAYKIQSFVGKQAFLKSYCKPVTE